jgi:hypothetical protein
VSELALYLTQAVLVTRRLLFLDDNPDRHVAFGTMSPGCSIVHVWTARECIDALCREGETFDCAFLDHDLDGEIYVTEIEGSGTEVAYYVRDQLPAERLPRSFVVHSLNPAGAERMREAISQRGVPTERVPFSYPDAGRT